MNKKESNLSLIVRGYKLLFKICPKFMKWSVIRAIIDCLVSYFPIYMSSLIVNELASTQNSDRLIMLVLITIVGFLILSIIRKIINNFT